MKNHADYPLSTCRNNINRQLTYVLQHRQSQLYVKESLIEVIESIYFVPLFAYPQGQMYMMHKHHLACACNTEAMVSFLDSFQQLYLNCPFE